MRFLDSVGQPVPVLYMYYTEVGALSPYMDNISVYKDKSCTNAHLSPVKILGGNYPEVFFQKNQPFKLWVMDPHDTILHAVEHKPKPHFKYSWMLKMPVLEAVLS